MYLKALEILFSHKKYKKFHYMGLTTVWIHILHVSL